MPARLNRRRYREAVAALKQIISDQKTPAARRLHAVDTLLGIYDRHDRTEERKKAQRRVADAPGDGTVTPDAPDPIDALLERLKADRENTEVLA